MPALVATAFPPLNLRKIGKQCPITAITPNNNTKKMRILIE